MMMTEGLCYDADFMRGILKYSIFKQDVLDNAWNNFIYLSVEEVQILMLGSLSKSRKPK